MRISRHTWLPPRSTTPRWWIRTHVEFATRPTTGTSHAVIGYSGTGDRSNEASGATLRQPAVPPIVTSTCFAALPKLHIHTFSGDRRSWQGFWDRFDATIHSDPALALLGKLRS